MNRIFYKFCTAAALSCCLAAAAAFPAAAEPAAVVGGAPGEELSTGAESSTAETKTAAETISAAAESAAGQTAGAETLVPALPVETGAAPKETTAAETTAAPKETTVETSAVPKETTAAETTAAPKATTAETSAAPKETTAARTEAPAPEAESAASAPPDSGGKSSYAAEAPQMKSEEAAAREALNADPTGKSAAAKAVEPDMTHETLTKEELAALDLVTGPGVAQVSGGSKSGVSEPVVSQTKTSGAAPATDWSRVSDVRKRIVDMAKSFIGGTYVYGGASPSEGFDCSGLIMYVYREAADITLAHQSASQASKGRAVSVTEMQPGDIIAYDGSPKDGAVNHVSIYAGDGMAVHAVGTGKGIRITAFDYAAPLTIRNVLGD